MDPLEAPLPGLFEDRSIRTAVPDQQQTENHPWLDELEESFFTMPPVERDLEPEEVEITWKARSPWPARLFVGACVAVVAASSLLVMPIDLFGPAAVRYPLEEVIAELDTGPADEPGRKAVRMRRARKSTPKKLSATRPWTLPPATKVPTPAPGPVETAPMRVDALPAADLSKLEPGATL